MRWARALGAAVVVASVASLAGRASADDPTVQTSVGAGTPGETILVTLGGWFEPVTVTICGNEARRGATDCTQVTSVGVGSSALRPQTREFVLGLPPVPCPCVIRAATAGERIIRTAPFDLRGAPAAPLSGQGPQGAAGASLAVEARVSTPDRSLSAGIRSSLAGRSDRMLILRVANISANPVRNITIAAAVGRQAHGGEPLQAPAIQQLLPGERREVAIDATLPAPSIGSYVVFGTVYGGELPVNFAMPTSNRPFGLILLVMLFVADLEWIFISRARRARRRPATEPVREEIALIPPRQRKLSGDAARRERALRERAKRQAKVGAGR